MQLSIVSLPPLLPGQKPGCSGDMPQDLQKSVSPQTRDLPRTVPWISLSVKLNIRVRYTSDQGAQSYVVGTYQGIFKNPPPPPIPCKCLGTLDITKFKIKSPSKPLLSPGSRDPGIPLVAA